MSTRHFSLVTPYRCLALPQLPVFAYTAAMWFFYATLTAFCWALINILDSILVHHYEKKPMALMWSQSMWSLPILLILSQMLPLESTWIPLLLAFGVIGYFGDVWFFHVLEHVDVSISNLAWALLSLFLAFAGFLFFGESWTLLQTLGALLTVIGTLVLLLFHQHVDIRHSIFLVVSLSLLYVPFYVMKKAAVDGGQNPAAVFFWLVLAREITSFSLPFFFPSVRRTAITAIRASWSFSLINACVIVTFFAAEYFGTLAYASGSLSLVAIVNNVQPFFVLGLAAFCSWFMPKRVPRELLSRQSVWIKICTFLVVFLGLALLVLH
jgi:drug/metabolite transporter (DMT)-like permease